MDRLDQDNISTQADAPESIGSGAADAFRNAANTVNKLRSETRDTINNAVGSPNGERTTPTPPASVPGTRPVRTRKISSFQKIAIIFNGNGDDTQGVSGNK